MKRLIIIVVAGLFLLSASSVLAQGMPCIADLNCDHNVDANDVVIFLGQFGRNPFFEPCPDCYDSPCPCSSTVPKTGQTTSYATGDDGDLEKGLILPNPRFTDNGDGTVTDNLTGLIWLKNADCFGSTRTWNNALSDCNGLASGNCGLTDGSQIGDWRLPHIKELQSLIAFKNAIPALPSGHPFNNVQSNYWSSTTTSLQDGYAWFVQMVLGGVDSEVKFYNHYVWCVKGGH